MRKKLVSRCGDEMKRGSADELSKHYEGLGYAAERQKNYTKMHFYWQHAEYYKRVKYE